MLGKNRCRPTFINVRANGRLRHNRPFVALWPNGSDRLYAAARAAPVTSGADAQLRTFTANFHRPRIGKARSS